VAGVFTVHPSSGTAISISFVAGAGPYFLLQEVDFREDERLRIVYEDTPSGGSIKSIDFGSVEIQLHIAVIGTSLDGVSQNLRTLQDAFLDPEGGTIEYKPLDYGDSVLHTYYHYLPSPPPRRTHRKVAAHDNAYAESYEFTIRIKAWATSDPDAPVNIVSDQTLDPRLDDDDSNLITISSASIKGDAALPIMRIGSGGSSLAALLMWIKDGGVADGGVMDDDEADTGLTNFTEVTGAGSQYSFGKYYNLATTTATGQVVFKKGDNIDFVRKVMPMVVFYANALETVKITVSAVNGLTYQTASVTVTPVGISSPSLVIFPSFWQPPISMPAVAANRSASNQPLQNLDIYFSNILWTVDVERTNAQSGGLKLDNIVLAYADLFIAQFNASAANFTLFNHLGINTVEGRYDAVEWVAATGDAAPVTARQNPIKYGSPIESMILRSGIDHHLQVIPIPTVDNDDARILQFGAFGTTVVNVDLVYATIYPFDTA
jgi:hypothetical protein